MKGEEGKCGRWDAAGMSVVKSIDKHCSAGVADVEDMSLQLEAAAEERVTGPAPDTVRHQSRRGGHQVHYGEGVRTFDARSGWLLRCRKGSVRSDDGRVDERRLYFRFGLVAYPRRGNRYTGLL